MGLRPYFLDAFEEDLGEGLPVGTAGQPRGLLQCFPSGLLGVEDGVHHRWGWTATSVGPETREEYVDELGMLGDALLAWRHSEQEIGPGPVTAPDGDAQGSGATPPDPVDPSGPETNRVAPALRGCGRRIRVATRVLDAVPDRVRAVWDTVLTPLTEAEP